MWSVSKAGIIMGMGDVILLHSAGTALILGNFSRNPQNCSQSFNNLVMET